jgi:hypothetical protein
MVHIKTKPWKGGQSMAKVNINIQIDRNDLDSLKEILKKLGVNLSDSGVFDFILADYLTKVTSIMSLEDYSAMVKISKKREK